ncbi:MAG TPA: hypothetical protein VLC09_00335 [Polyangiaceae bacterium]|nr:hypothetical protein [Polyangiaceae bacterium]
MRRRWLTLGVASIGSVLFVGGCLTPDFEFGDPPVADGGGAPPLPAHCSNGNVDTSEGETDQDCGGPCDPCDDGKICLVNRDCSSSNCSEGVCLREGTCEDGLANGGESDEDCGAVCTGQLCDDGKKCGSGADCESQICKSGICQVPTCTDKKQNGDETDVDCGPSCPCALGRRCGEASDCADEGAVCNEVCQLPLEVVDRKNLAWDTLNNGGLPATLVLNPAGAAVGHRALLVLVTAYQSEDAVPVRVRYGNKDLTLVSGSENNDITELFAGTYYLNECELADASGTTLSVQMSGTQWRGVTFDALYVENAGQDFETGTAASDGGASQISLESSIGSLDWFFGAAISPGGSILSVAPTSPTPNDSKTLNVNNELNSAGTLFGPLAKATETFTWQASGSERKAATGLRLTNAAAPPAACP